MNDDCSLVEPAKDILPRSAGLIVFLSGFHQVIFFLGV